MEYQVELTKDRPIQLLTYLKSDETEGIIHVKNIPASKGKAMQIVDDKGNEAPIAINFNIDNNLTLIYVGMITIIDDEVFSYEMLTKKTDVYFGKLVSLKIK